MSRVDLGREEDADKEDDEREHPDAVEGKRRRSREGEMTGNIRWCCGIGQ